MTVWVTLGAAALQLSWAAPPRHALAGRADIREGESRPGGREAACSYEPADPGPSATGAYATVRGPREWAFVRLDSVRREKVRQLRSYCQRMHALARKAGADGAIRTCFDIGLRYHHAAHRSEPSASLRDTVSRLESALRDYYITTYLAFHDILFVAADGHVFFTVRQEEDASACFLRADLVSTPLGACLGSAPETERYIDFHYYNASDEAAAFFVEPVMRDGTLQGWIVLQCAINKINTLFAGSDELGQTGETFLVNRDGFMLTESYFEGEPTILSKRLDNNNIEAKFAGGEGNRVVTDYRGHVALTSFEAFEFMEARWLVVAKLDEAQMLSEHFLDHRRFFTETLVREIRTRAPAPGRSAVASASSGKLLRIDMDEIIRASHEERLQTFGVCTCTCLVAAYPGQFGYMAHISPLDKAYGGRETNLVGHLLKKITTFDVYPSQRRQVRYVIIAPHCRSVPNILDKLMTEGVLLSQISVMHHPTARYADVTYDYARDHIQVAWRLVEGGACVHDERDALNVADAMRALVASAPADAAAESLLSGREGGDGR